jgi:hypothetical protein
VTGRSIGDLPVWVRGVLASTLGLIIGAAVYYGLDDADGPSQQQPRMPQYVTACDGTTGNRVYYFTGLGQAAVAANDPNCPLVVVE